MMLTTLCGQLGAGGGDGGGGDTDPTPPSGFAFVVNGAGDYVTNADDVLVVKEI